MIAKSAVYGLVAASIAAISLGMATDAHADWPPPPPPYIPGYPVPPPYVPGYPPPPLPPYGNGYPGQTPIQMDPTQVPGGPVSGGGANDLGGGQAAGSVTAGGPNDLGGGQATAPVTGGGGNDLGGGQASAPVTGGGDVPIYLDPNISSDDPFGDNYGVPPTGCGCQG